MTAAQEVVREVGISHCNNSRSLVEHSHASDSVHYIVDTLRKEVLSFLWDLGYYLTKKERDDICEVFDNVQHAIADLHFQETINNYHKHHFEINRETESKGLRSWATDAIAITQMYKQLVYESKRLEEKKTNEYVDELVSNFVTELKAHNQKLTDLFAKFRRRNDCYNPISTPLLPIEHEHYTALKDIVGNRPKATWLTLHGDRPNQTLGLPKPDEPLPTGNQVSFQGGRNLYEKYFNERKTALNYPKYMYKVQQLHAKNEEARLEARQALLDMPQRR